MIALELFVQACIMAAVAMGAWVAMADGMVLAPFRKIIELEIKWQTLPTEREQLEAVRKKFVLPVWIRNPLASCPRCMCSVWGIAALLICGFSTGIDINFVRETGMMKFTPSLDLVPARLPFIAVDWARLAQMPVLVLMAVGIQDLVQRD